MIEGQQPEGERLPYVATPGDGLIQPRDDGQLHFLPETAADTFPVTAPTDATPLGEDEPEGIIPKSPLWAMRERRHEQFLHIFGHPDRIRVCIGDGDDAVYAIDDGKRHCMIGHRVGATLDGVIYSLVARVDKATFESLASGAITGADAFAASHEAGLSGTVEEPGVSNIFDIDYYQPPSEIPAEYLPGRPFMEFARDLPTSDR